MTEQIPFPPLRDLSRKTLETRKRHLLSEIRREPERRHVRLRLAVPALAAICLAATCAVVFSGALRGSNVHRPTKNVAPYWSPQNSNDAVGLPTLARPLFLGRQVTLAEASASLGIPLVLPDTTLVTPSDAGTVWEVGRGSPFTTSVAIT